LGIFPVFEPFGQRFTGNLWFAMSRFSGQSLECPVKILIEVEGNRWSRLHGNSFDNRVQAHSTVVPRAAGEISASLTMDNALIGTPVGTRVDAADRSRYHFTSWVIKHLGKYDVQSANLDAIFSALADPTRRAILLRLALGEATVNELAGPFAISLPAVSKHLKVLERAGLITRGKEAQFRPCRLETDQLKFAFDWLERYRQHWEESFDRLDDYLQEVQNAEKDTDKR